MNVPASAPQSTFVTVLAWVVIILSGFAAVIGVVQNVLINFLEPTMMTNGPNAQAAAFPLAVFRALAFCLLIFVIFMTYCAYALLRRRNWARITFMVIGGLAIAWFLLCILIFALRLGPARFAATGPTAALADMRGAFNTMLVMTSIVTLGLSVLFGWIIKRLRSPQIRAEFVQRDVVPGQ
jgi:uncharacterized protein (DUF486 family)